MYFSCWFSCVGHSDSDSRLQNIYRGGRSGQVRIIEAQVCLRLSEHSRPASIQCVFGNNVTCYDSMNHHKLRRWYGLWYHSNFSVISYTHYRYIKSSIEPCNLFWQTFSLEWSVPKELSDFSVTIEDFKMIYWVWGGRTA